MPSTGVEHGNDDLHVGKEPSCPKEQKDALALVLPSAGVEHGNNDHRIGSSEVPTETSQQLISDIQTSVDGISAKDTDDTNITRRDLPEPSFEGSELGAGSRKELTAEKHLNKIKIILATMKDIKASSQ